jgi:hypothetical protein
MPEFSHPWAYAHRPGNEQREDEGTCGEGPVAMEFSMLQ